MSEPWTWRVEENPALEIKIIRVRSCPFVVQKFKCETWLEDNNAMTITLNGEKREFENLRTLTDVLREIGLDGRPVVVEQNQRALFPREIPDAVVADGDVIEIVQVTAGG